MIAAVATLLATIGALYYNAQSSRQATEQANQAQVAQASERFSRSVEQLGSSSVTVRIGAVYSFGRLMRDSNGDQRAIIEILSSFIRLRAAQTPGKRNPGAPTPTDIDAALVVLAHQPKPKVPGLLQDVNFSGLHLAGADLSGANLKSADLAGANLAGADLPGADLTDATLTGVDLTGVDLTDANLTGDDLTSANLTDATLTSVYLTRARLVRANLARADLTSANLDSADLTRANLNEANLTDAILTSAILTHADLADANFTRVFCGISERAAPECTKAKAGGR